VLQCSCMYFVYGFTIGLRLGSGLGLDACKNNTLQFLKTEHSVSIIYMIVCSLFCFGRLQFLFFLFFFCSHCKVQTKSFAFYSEWISSCSWWLSFEPFWIRQHKLNVFQRIEHTTLTNFGKSSSTNQRSRLAIMEMGNTVIAKVILQASEDCLYTVI